MPKASCILEILQINAHDIEHNAYERIRNKIVLNGDMHITYLSRNQSSCLEFRPEKNFHEELFYHCHCLDSRADGDYKKQATF